VAMRIISEKEYGNFVAAVEKIPQARRETEKEELINELETNLYLVGATAVLDRLQDDVAETIRDLIRASTPLPI
jgi:phospholipid-transporting ATPase